MVPASTRTDQAIKLRSPAKAPGATAQVSYARPQDPALPQDPAHRDGASCHTTRARIRDQQGPRGPVADRPSSLGSGAAERFLYEAHTRAAQPGSLASPLMGITKPKQRSVGIKELRSTAPRRGDGAGPAGHARPPTSERATLRQGLSCLCPAGTGQPPLRRTRTVDRNCCPQQRLSRHFSS